VSDIYHKIFRKFDSKNTKNNFRKYLHSNCSISLVTKLSPLKDENFDCEISFLFFRFFLQKNLFKFEKHIIMEFYVVFIQ